MISVIGIITGPAQGRDWVLQYPLYSQPFLAPPSLLPGQTADTSVSKFSD